MYVMEYLIYHLRPYGTEKKLPGDTKLSSSSSRNQTAVLNDIQLVLPDVIPMPSFDNKLIPPSQIESGVGTYQKSNNRVRRSLTPNEDRTIQRRNHEKTNNWISRKQMIEYFYVYRFVLQFSYCWIYLKFEHLNVDLYWAVAVCYYYWFCIIIIIMIIL